MFSECVCVWQFLLDLLSITATVPGNIGLSSVVRLPWSY